MRKKKIKEQQINSSIDENVEKENISIDVNVEEISFKDNLYDSTIKLKFKNEKGKSEEKHVNVSQLSEQEKDVFSKLILIIKNI